ncbi:MAG TPA: molybdenum cofactor biosynthesis protein MoaE [Rhizomicrobium sp.]|nr:molybdenum cofactor biosynthesis protein MoaE [Rhizomicrobium sp.]
MKVRISEHPFNPQDEEATFVDGRSEAGALVSFVGYCRNSTAGKSVTALHLEHYKGFTERQITHFTQGVARRYGLLDALVVHRVGTMCPGDAIVLVSALAVHRTEAFEGVQVLMDYLKTDAPFWKKELGPDGERWIEPSENDYARRAQMERNPYE